MEHNYYINNKHKGVVGFEYVIVLIIMTVSLFIVFNILQTTLKNKGSEVAEFINNNGQNPLGNISNNNLTNNSNIPKEQNKEEPLTREETDKDYETKYCYSVNSNYDWINNNNNQLSYITLNNLMKYCKDKQITNIQVFYDDQNDFPNKGHITTIIDGRIKKSAYIWNLGYNTNKPIAEAHQMTPEELFQYMLN